MSEVTCCFTFGSECTAPHGTRQQLPSVGAGASDASRRAALVEEGERMEKLGITLFALGLLYSLLINVPFLAGELVYLSADDSDGALILISVSFCLNLMTLLAVMVCAWSGMPHRCCFDRHVAGMLLRVASYTNTRTSESSHAGSISSSPCTSFRYSTWCLRCS